ncbi:MAG: hypothetical protein WBE18_00055 [Gammaproteobacteria bacterium]
MINKNRDGIKLSYKIANEHKQQDFVLIHNAGGNHQFMDEQFKHLKQFCSEDAFRKHCPQVEVGKVIGAGHWATLEGSKQVNAMIERFLEIV